MNTDMLGRAIQDRYKLIDERGRGSFATVYIARDLQDNHLYAVKVMHLEPSGDGELLARFQREAHILLTLSDAHIVRFFDYGNDKDIYYIVMDYIDGQSLKDIMTNQGPLDPLLALHYAHQIAEGLDTAHKQGVVHRDIKPQNILVNRKDIVKIADFGLARGQDTVTLTQPDVFMGTAYYISPEQANNGRSADIRSDLYSLAAVLFEMLTGKPPYEGEVAYDIALKHTHDKIPSVCRQNPRLPIEMDRFMQKALAKSPADRFATPQEFIAALEQLQESVQEQSMHQRTQSPPREANLVVLSNGQIFPLKGELMLVGRADPKRRIYPEIDLTVTDTDKRIGRKHAYLRNRQGTYTVEDLNTLNKTRLNGVILTPYEERTLKQGDILRFGNVEARLELQA
jgi:serine/threonine-protein kinase